MKAIIVFPSLSNQAVYNSKLVRVPLGILSVAHHARLAGFDVSILDERRCLDAKTELFSMLRKEPPVCVGFSVMTGNQIHFALELSKIVKKNSSAVTIWGGVHPTLEPKSTVMNEFVDYVVIGEGEITFTNLMKAFRDNRSIDSVYGICYIDNKGQVVTTRNDNLPIMDSLVGIDYKQLPFHDYEESSTFFNFESSVILPVETSRGCPFKCTFCTEPAMGRAWRAMAPSLVIQELSRLRYDYGIRAIAFVDDLFFVQHRRSEELIDGILSSGLDIEWYANVRAEYIVKHGSSFFQKAAKSGCRSLTMGAEGGTDTVLKRVRKNLTVGKLLQANRILNDVGIAPHFSAIIGYPNETPQEVLSTINMACTLLRENNNAKVSLNKLIPTPGSLILSECTRSGFELPRSLEEWAEVFYTDASAWLMPETSLSLKHLTPFCELIGMVHSNSQMHDVLFEMISAMGDSMDGVHKLFVSKDASSALHRLMNMAVEHFKRYPMFGDEQCWQNR